MLLVPAILMLVQELRFHLTHCLDFQDQLSLSEKYLMGYTV